MDDVYAKIRSMTYEQFRKSPERNMLTKDAQRFVLKQKAASEGIKIKRKRKKRSVYIVRN